MNIPNMNYYEILGISVDATDKEIREAYLKLVKQYHPDVYKGEDAEEKIKAINIAYDTLIDDKKRKKYDQTIYIDQTNYTKTNNPENLDEIIDEIKNKIFNLNYELDCISLKLNNGDVKSLKNLDMWIQKASPLCNQILNLKKQSPKYNNIIKSLAQALYNMLKIAVHYQKNKSQIYQKAVSNIKEKILNLDYKLEYYCKKANNGDLSALENLDIITKKIINLYDELESLELLLLEALEKDYNTITIQLNNFEKQKERIIEQIFQKVEASKRRCMCYGNL